MSIEYSEFCELNKAQRIMVVRLSLTVVGLDSLQEDAKKFNGKIVLYVAREGMLGFCIVFDTAEDNTAFTLKYGTVYV